MLSWDIACNKKLKTWAQGAGIYVPLENYYPSITFIEGGRWAIPVSLIHRGRAVPEAPQQLVTEVVPIARPLEAAGASST